MPSDQQPEQQLRLAPFVLMELPFMSTMIA